MPPIRPIPLSDLARAENVPEELQESLLEEEPGELEMQYRISPELYRALLESFHSVIDTSETTYLLLGSYGNEGHLQLESVQEAVNEYSHVRAYLPIDFPNHTQQPLLTLKHAADLVDHILFIIDSDATESKGVALELGLLLEEHRSKTHILLHEAVMNIPLAFNVYEALLTFEGETRVHNWSSEDDLLGQINHLVRQHTYERANDG